MKKSKIKIIRIYFWIGVNIIGIPEIKEHRLSEKYRSESKYLKT